MIMLKASNSRYINVAFLAVLVCVSLYSPHLFVICMGDGDAATIEPFHAGHSSRMTHCNHGDDSSGSRNPEFAHHHASCRDLPLSGNLGNIQEKERLADAQVEDTYLARNPAPTYAEAPISNSDHHPLLEQIHSVILII
jgi:hypothetical protein